MASAPVAKRLRISKQTFPFYTQMLEALGEDNGSAVQTVYLLIVSGGDRGIEQLSRRELADAIKNAFGSPAASASGAGRPQTRDGPLVRQIPTVSPLSFSESPSLCGVRGSFGLARISTRISTRRWSWTARCVSVPRRPR